MLEYFAKIKFNTHCLCVINDSFTKIYSWKCKSEFFLIISSHYIEPIKMSYCGQVYVLWFHCFYVPTAIKSE